MKKTLFVTLLIGILLIAACSSVDDVKVSDSDSGAVVNGVATILECVDGEQRWVECNNCTCYDGSWSCTKMGCTDCDGEWVEGECTLATDQGFQDKDQNTNLDLPSTDNDADSTNTKEFLTELDLNILGSEITAKTILTENVWNTKDVIALTAEIDYDESIFNVEFKNLMTDVLCEFDENSLKVACASAKQLPKGDMFEFKFNTKKTPDAASTYEIEFNLESVNGETINLQLTKDFKLGCKTGLDCEKDGICINGLCRESCDKFNGIACGFEDNGLAKSGICTFSDRGKGICDTNTAVKSELGVEALGYWSDCLAPESLVEVYASGQIDAKRLFDDQRCDPNDLSEGFSVEGFCLNGICEIEGPNLTVQDVEYSYEDVNGEQGFWTFDVEILNEGNQKAEYTQAKWDIVSVTLCKNEKCSSKTVLGKESVPSGWSLIIDNTETFNVASIVLAPNPQIISEDKYYFSIKVDPNNKVEETIEEDNEKNIYVFTS